MNRTSRIKNLVCILNTCTGGGTNKDGDHFRNFRMYSSPICIHAYTQEGSDKTSGSVPFSLAFQ